MFWVGLIKSQKYKILDNLNDDYIKMFWVGLMDGHGDIQINHLNYKSLQFRLIIKFNKSELNYNMLINIAGVIGGNVKVVNDKKEIIWVLDKKEIIPNIMDILVKYPPLTSRFYCQLEFLKVCLSNDSARYFLYKRNSKYNIQSNIIKQYNNKFIIPHYFPYWLSGFIVSKGCFSIREKGNHSFLIGHNNDYYLLDAIKNFFNLNVKIKIKKKNRTFYSVETYKKETLNKIINHCLYYPLLGEKAALVYKLKKNVNVP